MKFAFLCCTSIKLFDYFQKVFGRIILKEPINPTLQPCCSFTKELVVKVHNPGKTAKVYGQIAGFHLKVFLKLRGQYSPIAVTPAVNCLLHIANHHAKTILSQAIANQRFKVLPLNNRGILKLIEHKAIVAGTDFLINKRCVVLPNKLTKQWSAIG